MAIDVIPSGWTHSVMARDKHGILVWHSNHRGLASASIEFEVCLERANAVTCPRKAPYASIQLTDKETGDVIRRAIAGTELT